MLRPHYKHGRVIHSKLVMYTRLMFIALRTLLKPQEVVKICQSAFWAERILQTHNKGKKRNE
jgi:hypothetical protein